MLIPFDELFARHNVKCTGILHCGASYCQERDMYVKLGIPEVIWVEAIPNVYEEAQINLRGYKNQIILNACLDDESGKIVTFNISNNESQSSSMLPLGYHKVCHPEVFYREQLELVTIRLDDLLEGYNVNNLNFLNADLQGSELAAIKGLGELIHNFDYMYLEVNKRETYIGGALVDEVDEYLKQYGFERVETSAWVGDCWTDAFYIKNHSIHRY